MGGKRMEEHMGQSNEKQHQDIRERTFQFAVRIVNLCQHLDETPGVNWTLSKQLLRSGTSIGANAEEAQAAQSKADFISKFSIALKEANESYYWLRLMCDAGYLELQKAKQLGKSAEHIIHLLIRSLKTAKFNV